MTIAKFQAKIIVPKEATNLITNPSFESGLTTGWAAAGAGVSIAVTSTAGYQRRGARALELTTATGVDSHAYYDIALTAGTSYAWSLDTLGCNGQALYLRIMNNAWTTGGTLAFTGSAYWRRRSVIYTPAATETHHVEVYRASVASTAKLYIDGALLEVGSVASTYFDGDSVGYLPGETAYRWNGLRHASTSWRSGQTRTGGTYVNIGDYARILAIIGLGMAPLTNIAVPSSMGGSYYQNTVAGERPFSMVVNFHSDTGDYGEIERDKAAIINAIKPDLVTHRQPLTLQIDQLDSSNNEAAETLEFPVVYEGGLEGDGSGDNYNERGALNFRTYLPMIFQQGEKGAALGYQTSVTDFANIGYRDTDGTWKAMGTGINGAVYCMAKAPDGSIYVGGNFTSAGGVADTGYLARWNGTAWVSVIAGLNGAVYAIAFDAAGNLYFGGAFTDAGGVAAADYIAKWDGSTVTALGSGTGGIVRALALGANNKLYIGGDFTNLTDSDGDLITVWDGSTYTSIGSGLSGTSVRALAVDKAGNVYAGGDFLASGATDLYRIATWNGSAWSAMGEGFNDTVSVIKIAPDSSIYVGGEFSVSSATGIPFYAIARWNGVSWDNVAGGVAGSSRTVSDISISSDGLVYVCGYLTSAGGVSTPDNMAVYHNGAWSPMDIYLGGSVVGVYSILPLDDGRVYISGLWTGTTATGATVTASNVGSASAYPVVTFTGPGSTYQLVNYTTGKAVYFNLTLLAGEVATLDLNPIGVSFTSSFRGNIMSTILPGSDLTWELLPGANNVSAFMFGGTSAASKIIMTWRDGYWSLDGAAH